MHKSTALHLFAKLKPVGATVAKLLLYVIIAAHETISEP